jgi:Flp pilus assembly protein TadG
VPGPTAGADDGSALVLFPAGMLALLVLAAIAFDFSIAYQRKRALVDLAATSAADAVTYGLDGERFRATGDYCLDPSRARAAIAEDVAASDLAATVVSVELRADDARPGCATGVEVTLRATAPAFFAKAVPGAADERSLEATMGATAVER